MMGRKINLVKYNGAAPPPTSIKLARQNVQGEYWSVVAHTQYGDIPAKAIGNLCTYAYGGQEIATENFSWLVARCPIMLQKNNGSGAPRQALSVGNQSDGAGRLYAAIARTEHGTIPGKAKDNTCWYGIYGTEHYTAEFDWVVWR